MGFDFSRIYSVGVYDGYQDGVIYQGYVFSFTTRGVCKVSRLENGARIAEFALDKVDIHAPHCNSVCFGVEKYTPADEFPLLYANIYNNDPAKKGVCNVYRIVREGEVFSSTLVQILQIGFVDDADKWVSGVRPYGNFAVDTDEDTLWVFAMDDSTQTTKFYQFPLPNSREGVYDEHYQCPVFMLQYESCKEQFSTEYIRFMQGCCYHDGCIYSTEGFDHDSVNIPAIRVIDLRQKKQVYQLLLPTAFTLYVEPEFICVYEGKLYYKDCIGNLYYFKGAI